MWLCGMRQGNLEQVERKMQCNLLDAVLVE